MITLMQRAAITTAKMLLSSVGLKTWFDVRLIRDSDKSLFGARIGAVSDDLDSLMDTVEKKRVALRPEFRFELRMYVNVVRTRGMFMGLEIEEPPAKTAPDSGLVIAGVKPLDQWTRPRKFKARASGVALPPKDPEHTCDADGPMRQTEGGYFLATCSVCTAFTSPTMLTEDDSL